MVAFWSWIGIIVGAIMVVVSFRDRRWLLTLLGLIILAFSTFGATWLA